MCAYLLPCNGCSSRELSSISECSSSLNSLSSELNRYSVGSSGVSTIASPDVCSGAHLQALPSTLSHGRIHDKARAIMLLSRQRIDCFTRKACLLTQGERAREGMQYGWSREIFGASITSHESPTVSERDRHQRRSTTHTSQICAHVGVVLGTRDKVTFWHHWFVSEPCISHKHPMVWQY